jgi:glutathione S-transferase
MHLGARENLSDEYLQLNPNGVVPTLVDGGEVVIDSSVICEYLDEAYPDTPLTPVSPIERARMRSWMRYFEEVPTAAIRIPSINMMFMGSIRAMGPQWHDLVKLSPLRKGLYEQIGEHGFDDKTLSQSIQALYSCCVRVEAALTDGAFLFGNEISIADIVLLPTIVRMDDLGLLTDTAKWPKLWIWYKKLQARESYRKCYFDGSRVIPDT